LSKCNKIEATEQVNGDDSRSPSPE
jgi:hypothetical protein